MPTVPRTIDNAQATTPTNYAIVPIHILRDPHLSDAAVRLYGALDGRLTEVNSQRIRQDTLAADLGWSVQKVKRTIKELMAVGLIEGARTSRSSRYKVKNTARRPVDNLESEVSLVIPQEKCSATGDTAEVSLVIPPQIINSLIIKNNNIAAGQPLASASVGAEKKPKTADCLAAIKAATGITVDCNKTVIAKLGKIKALGITPADLGALVAAYLAVAGELTNPAGYVAAHVLEQIAAGNRPPKPTAAPKHLSPSEIANAQRCGHGEIVGRCAICRSNSADFETAAIAMVAHVIPAATFIERNADVGEDFDELIFDLHGGSLYVVFNGYGATEIINVWLSLDEYQAPGTTGAHRLNDHEWKRLVRQAYSRTELKPSNDHDSYSNEYVGLYYEHYRPANLETAATDLAWFARTFPLAMQPADTVWQHVACLIPRAFEIRANGDVAEVVRNGDVVAHVSTGESKYGDQQIKGLTLFPITHWDPADTEGRNEPQVLAYARKTFKPLSSKFTTVEVHTGLPGDFAVAIKTTNDHTVIEAFDLLTQLENDINQQFASKHLQSTA